MQFETFKSRRVTIKQAQKNDIDEYRRQAGGYNISQKEKIKVLKDDSIYYLAIYTNDDKMIGMIQANELNDESSMKIVTVKISIPNKSWRAKYGKEIIHQFVKCCEERKMYDRVYLDKEEPVVNAYRAERPEMFKDERYVICIG